MSIVQYEPWNMLTRVREQMNKMFDTEFLPSLWDEEGSVVTSHWTPMVDVKEEDDRFLFLADIPGVDAKDIEVTADDGNLTIRGERKTASEQEREGYKRVERSYGSFYRRFSLPGTADTDHIQAKQKDGVLEVTVPKIEKAKQHKIEVKS